MSPTLGTATKNLAEEKQLIIGPIKNGCAVGQAEMEAKCE